MRHRRPRLATQRIQAGILCLVVLLLASMVNPTDSFVNDKLPYLRWSNAWPAALLATLIASASLAARKPTAWRLTWVTLVLAYTASASAVAIIGSWFDFVNRDGRYRGISMQVPHWLQTLIDKASEISLGASIWVLLTPLAIVAAVLIFAAIWLRRSTLDALGHRLPVMLLYLSLPIALFNLGTTMAELRLPSGEVVASEVTLPLALTVLLGALLSYAGAAPSREEDNEVLADADSAGLDLDKMTATASQLSVVLLVLLGLGLSQTLAYGDALYELVSAREALASDLVSRQLASANPNKYGSVLEVHWAHASVNKSTVRAPASEEVVVKSSDSLEVTEDATKEMWEFPVQVVASPPYIQTQRSADHLGVKYDKAEEPEQIYPRLDAQLRAKDVAFPGVGLSLGLKGFVLLIPLVIGATLVLLAYRLDGLLQRPGQLKEPWILIESARGLAAIVPHLWLACVVMGPCLLAVVLVEVIALTNKTHGMAQTTAADWVSTVYIALALALLLAPVKSSFVALMRLRYRRIATLTADDGELTDDAG